MTPWREIRAVADRRAAGHDADAGGRGRASSAAACPCRRTASAPWSIDASTMSPNRKPSRMPCFTQALTRQPVGLRRIGLGGAHVAGATARRAAARTRRAPPSRSAVAPGANSSSMSVSSRVRCDAPSASTLQQSPRLDRAPAESSSATRGRGRHHRQPVHLLEQAHRRHRRLHRNRVRLDEVDVHQRQERACASARAAAKSPRSARFDHLRHLGRHLVRRHRDDAAAADRHQRQRHRIVAGQHDEVRRHERGRPRTSASCCRRLPSRRRCSGSRRAARASRGSTLQPVRPGTL